MLSYLLVDADALVYLGRQFAVRFGVLARIDEDVLYVHRGRVIAEVPLDCVARRRVVDDVEEAAQRQLGARHDSRHDGGLDEGRATQQGVRWNGGRAEGRGWAGTGEEPRGGGGLERGKSRGEGVGWNGGRAEGRGWAGTGEEPRGGGGLERGKSRGEGVG